MEHKINTEALLKSPAGHEFLVVGAGVSGLAAAEYLLKKQAVVTLADNKAEADLPQDKLAPLKELGVKLHCGGMPEDVASFAAAIVSPGLPLDAPIAIKLLEDSVPIIGELELAYLCSHNPYLAITGTNGKTTTTSLLGHIVKCAGINHIVGGNIGLPLINIVEELPADAVIVAEVSSFQLETAKEFKPRAAAFLNLTPDHLNRHHTMENYGRIKANIFANQSADDFAVLNYDDEFVRALAADLNAKVLFFSRRSRVENGFFAADGRIYKAENGEVEPIMAIDDIFIKGGHNVENVLAACAMAYAAGIEIKVICEAVKSFRGVAHRQEYVREVNGVVYVNDSKGTNPDSTLRALEAYDQSMVLILGGYDKKISFESLLPLIKQKVRHVVLLGEVENQLKEMLDTADYKAYTCCGMDFAKTVQTAVEKAEAGDVVMFSPACASWDMFKNFEQRGDLFKDMINAL